VFITMEYKTIEWNREKLYEQIWASPLRTVAREYGLSDVGLAKVCKKLNIPKPGLGYWRRKERGFKVTQPPLPTAAKDQRKVVSYVRVGQPSQPTPIPPEFLSPLKAPRVTAAMHPIVQQTYRAFSKGTPDQFSRLRSSEWRLPTFALRVTKPGLERAVQFLDMLVKLLEANDIGVKVIQTGNEAPIVAVQVDQESIRIIIREDVRGRKRELNAEERRRHTRDPGFYPRDFGWTYDSTNRFAFEIQNYSDSGRRWADGKQRKIEDYTEEIVYGLRACAAYEKRRRIEQEAERKRADERLRIRMKQQARVERLRTNMSRWEESQRVRAYLEAVRNKVKERDGELNEESLIPRFLAWGNQFADELDPTGNPASSDWDEDNE
jgi:hypothetical protein